MPLLPLALFALLAGAAPIDRILAVVGERVVTASDVELEQALAGHLGCPEPMLCDPSRPPLDRLIDIALIRGLASDASTYRPASDELDRRMATVRASWPDAQEYTRFLARFGFTDDDLAGYVYSQMVVERYVQRNVDLAVAAAGPGRDLAAAYVEWIGRQRQQVSIRRIPEITLP